jgi:hypothetical protein
MDNNEKILRLKENFGDNMILLNLPPSAKYFYKNSILKESHMDNLSHLLIFQDIPKDKLTYVISDICPDIEIPLIGDDADSFQNEVLMMINHYMEIYPEDVKLLGGDININKSSDVSQILKDGICAMAEKYFSGESDRIEESSSLDDIIWKDMDDDDVNLAYMLATKKKANSPEEARRYIKNDISNNPKGSISKVLKSSFLRDYSFKEALDIIPLKEMKRVSTNRFCLFESKGHIVKVEKKNNKYNITKFKNI